MYCGYKIYSILKENIGLWSDLLKKQSGNIAQPFFVSEICVHLFINEDGNFSVLFLR